MNILLLGASGMIGSRILKEAVDRGHRVTAVSRHIDRLPQGANIRPVQADAKDDQRMAELAKGQDAIVFALSPRGDMAGENYVRAVRSVLQAAKADQTPYLLFVGGTSSLINANGKRVIDQALENIPRDKLAEPLTVIEARKDIEASGVNWTFLAPGGNIQPGERTGAFRLGGDHALVDFNPPVSGGKISAEDFAIAVVDDVEKRAHLRQIFHVVY